MIRFHDVGNGLLLVTCRRRAVGYVAPAVKVTHYIRREVYYWGSYTQSAESWTEEKRGWRVMSLDGKKTGNDIFQKRTHAAKYLASSHEFEVEFPPAVFPLPKVVFTGE